jgi:hypothetical protein
MRLGVLLLFALNTRTDDRNKDTVRPNRESVPTKEVHGRGNVNGRDVEFDWDEANMYRAVYKHIYTPCVAARKLLNFLGYGSP